MATPVSSTYAALTGAAIYGGRYPSSVLSGNATLGSVSASGTISSHAPGDGSVINNVWTPGKDVSGNITSASRAQLPLNEWCVVQNTAIRTLNNKLLAIGIDIPTYDYGNGGLVGSFGSFSGLAYDAIGKRGLHPHLGGHSDGSLNGIWSTNLNRLGGVDTFSIVTPPSNPDDPTFPWSANYKNLVGISSFTQYTPTVTSSTTGVMEANSGVDERGILPDSKPTSAHMWNGGWYDPVRGAIGTMWIRKWLFTETTGLWSWKYWRLNGANVQTDIGQKIHYHAPTDELIGQFGLGESAWSRVPAGGVNITMVPTPGLPWISNLSMATTRISATQILTLSNYGTTEAWGIFDIPLNTWTTGAVGGITKTYDYGSELMVCVDVPEWGKVLRRGRGNDQSTWWLFDKATKTNEVYTPLGLNPPMVGLVGNKCFYDADHKIVYYFVPLSLDANMVYVMRTG